MKKVDPSHAEEPRIRGKKRARETLQSQSREMRKHTVDPMRKTNANLYPEEEMLHLSECVAIVPRLHQVATVIETHSSVKVLMNPSCGNVVTRDEPKCAKCSSMISTFVTQVSTMTIHVLHGEPQSALMLVQAAHEWRAWIVPKQIPAACIEPW